MHLGDGRGPFRADSALDQLAHGFGFLSAEGEQEQGPGLHDRSQPLRDAAGGDLADVAVEEAGVVRARSARENFDAGARNERSARLVEADVPVGADSEDLQVHAARRSDRRLILPCSEARVGVRALGGAKARLGQPGLFRPHKLSPQDVAVLFRMTVRDSHVFVQREGGRALQGETPGGVRLAQLGVKAFRRGSGCHAEVRIRLAGQKIDDAARCGGRGFLGCFEDADLHCQSLSRRAVHVSRRFVAIPLVSDVCLQEYTFAANLSYKF